MGPSVCAWMKEFRRSRNRSRNCQNGFRFLARLFAHFRECFGCCWNRRKSDKQAREMFMDSASVRWTHQDASTTPRGWKCFPRGKSIEKLENHFHHATVDFCHFLSQSKSFLVDNVNRDTDPELSCIHRIPPSSCACIYVQPMPLRWLNPFFITCHLNESFETLRPNRRTWESKSEWRVPTKRHRLI